MTAKPAPKRRKGWEAFAHPQQVNQRRYEAVRAYLLDGASPNEVAARYGSMVLRLAWRSGPEAVDLDASGDADDAGLIFAGGEVAGLLGGPWAGPVGPVADEESRVEDLEQEGGQGQVKILRGENPP
jgi:hypothetical protein